MIELLQFADLEVETAALSPRAASTLHLAIPCALSLMVLICIIIILLVVVVRCIVFLVVLSFVVFLAFVLGLVPELQILIKSTLLSWSPLSSLRLESSFHTGSSALRWEQRLQSLGCLRLDFDVSASEQIGE